MSIHSMRVDQLHAELYEKMEEEQRVFVEKLKEKTPDEILKSAYEYIIREDFLAEMSCSTLPERQVRAMLDSQTPIADLYRKWIETEDPHMQDIGDTISRHSDEEADRLGIKDKRRDRNAR